MVVAKNTSYNRKLQLLERSGTVLAEKNGIVYFCFVMDQGEKQYFKCEESLFKKQFESQESTEIKVTISLNDKLEELLNLCKRYPY